MAVGHCGRSMRAARAAETSSGGWRVESVGKVQVGDVPYWDRRWVAGATDREMIRRRMLLMGVCGRRD